jgi:hypothetical protein
VSVRWRAFRWARARGGSGFALRGEQDGVGGGEPPEGLEREGMVGERDTEVAHLVMVAIRSVRTLL